MEPGILTWKKSLKKGYSTTDWGRWLSQVIHIARQYKSASQFHSSDSGNGMELSILTWKEEFKETKRYTSFTP